MFDNGYSLIMVYLLGGLAGTLYETYLNFHRRKGFVVCSGSIVTPFNFVYGFGGIVIFLSFFGLEPYFLTWWCWAVILVCGTFLGGFVEYILSFLEEKICHTRSWDYTGRKGSINGRTTIPIMIGWGFLCLFVMYGVFYPMMHYLIQPYILAYGDAALAYHITLVSLMGICCMDLVFVLVAIIRYSTRAEGRSIMFVGERFLDIVFSDSFMAMHFPQSRKTTLPTGIKSVGELRTYVDRRHNELRSLFTIGRKGE